MNICKNCKYFKEVIPTGTDIHGEPLPEGIWYNQFCGHESSKNQQVICPQSGELVFAQRQEFQFARDVNQDGRCPLYVEIENKIDWNEELKNLKESDDA